MSAIQALTLDDHAGSAVDAFDGVICTATMLVHRLNAAGVNAQEFFANYALMGEKAVKGESVLVKAGIKVSSPNWQQLMQLLLTYGPAIYAMLASMFGWPPIPFPIPTPTT
jgi:hypothetical protein